MTPILLALFAFSPTADAGRGNGGGGGGGADIETTLSMPASSDVYVDDSYSVTVANVGSGNADGVQLTIQLPETNTSPTVHTMGEVSNIDSRCSLSGTQLDCSLGRIRKGRSATVSFDMYLPQSAGSLDFSATATTTSSESATGNNSDSGSAVVIYEDIPLSGQYFVTNSHCTGQGLEAFYECTLYPSSISGHTVTYEADGTISFTQAGYTGAWGQTADDQLWFEYYDGTGNLVADFEGNGVDASAVCFEGLTVFPNSAWVAPYEVCLQ